ncbi:hypothetical protein AB1Y20_020899 [Prymnesium parvum]|uniref:Uncharacterized protein n=1 Tax=Prymnesium parvum TaxID=97485 RepID=A0AB34JZE7_PRYPA
MAALGLLWLPALVAATACEQCCAPGGSCAYAYKQTAGICCGRLDATSFCCPASAKCFRCSSGLYRCFNSGEPSCSICTDGDDPRPMCKSTPASGSFSPFAIGVLLAGCLLCGMCKRKRSSPDRPHAYHSFEQYEQGIPVAQQPYPQQPYPQAYPQQPYPQAYPQQPYPQAYPQQPYPQAYPLPYPQQCRQGSSGGAIAAGAGAGFLGGLLVGEAVSSSHHHHHRGSSGFGFGGNNGGGGDAGFSADN